SSKWAIYVCMGFLILLSLLVRKGLINFQNGDLQLFGNWYSFVKLHGLHSFKYAYSNYNPPYTYFLYLVTLLPLSKIVALKSLMFLFDIIMVVGIYFVVKVFRPDGNTALTAAITGMFLPIVLVTGVMWGQFDQFYVAFVLFSLYAGLNNKSKWAWIWFGVAIAIKFQAIFFFPVLIIMMFRRIHWYDAIWAVATFLVLSLPPVFAGRPLSSILNIYPAQANLANGILNLNAPNIWQWFPNSSFPFVYHLAIGLAVSACLFIFIYALQHKKFSKKELLICASLVLYVVPFLLPEMHERYFFPAGIVSMVLAFAYPSLVYVSIAVLAQVVILFSYGPFLFNSIALPFPILTSLMLLIICLLAGQYVLSNRNEITRPIIRAATAEPKTTSRRSVS
ncbi:MAG TPA: hypothetical protein VMR76_01215, partial [Candidatus Saccharimonadia bacterium]|nr:hypothetical protein [Candidatus Saccharimonadia bacterium]